MPFDEYAALPYAQLNGLFKDVTDLCLAKEDRGYIGFTRLQTSFPSDQISYIYLNKQDLDQKTSTDP